MLIKGLKLNMRKRYFLLSQTTNLSFIEINMTPILFKIHFLLEHVKKLGHHG